MLRFAWSSWRHTRFISSLFMRECWMIFWFNKEQKLINYSKGEMPFQATRWQEKNLHLGDTLVGSLAKFLYVLVLTSFVHCGKKFLTAHEAGLEWRGVALSWRGISSGSTGWS
jgi:hypothetical protein